MKLPRQALRLSKADRPAGSRVTAIRVSGAPLDDKMSYTVATNDFLSRGGDGYTMSASLGFMMRAFMQVIPQRSDLIMMLIGMVIFTSRAVVVARDISRPACSDGRTRC